MTPPTFQHVLLHLHLVELVGSDNDAVAGEVDATAGLQGLDLLGARSGTESRHVGRKRERKREGEQWGPGESSVREGEEG